MTPHFNLFMTVHKNLENRAVTNSRTVFPLTNQSPFHRLFFYQPTDHGRSTNQLSWSDPSNFFPLTDCPPATNITTTNLPTA